VHDYDIAMRMLELASTDVVSLKTQFVTPQPGSGKRLIMPRERKLPGPQEVADPQPRGPHLPQRPLLDLGPTRDGLAVGVRVIAVDEHTSISLVHTQAETYEFAVDRIEADLRDLRVVE